MLLAVLAACRSQGTPPAATPPALPVPRPAAPAPAFTDVSRALGIDFRHDAGLRGHHSLPEVMGGGGALFDADSDGDLDVLLPGPGWRQGPPPAASRSQPALYLQREDGRFEDASERAGLAACGIGMGVAVGDVDDDGDLDVLLTCVGNIGLWLNDGSGRFTDATSALGAPSEAWATSAAFFDADRDGRLDLVVASYVAAPPDLSCTSAAGDPVYCAPTAFPPQASRLWHNEGAGRFRDVSASAGLAAGPGNALGVTCADFSGDGLPDIYFANDQVQNSLWVNAEGGRFHDEAFVRGVAVNEFGHAEASMGVATGDLDGDLLPDLFMTHLDRETNTLYLGEAGGRFRDASAASGLALPSLDRTGFGTALFDFDNDGDLDVVVANGRVLRGETAADDTTADGFLAAYGQHAQLFANLGGGRFADITDQAGDLGAALEVGRGLAVGDLDDDGDLDIVLVACNGLVRVLRNDAARAGTALLVRAILPESGRDAVGAVVTAWIGGQPVVRRIDPAGSYLSSSDARAHFGLGAAGAVERFEVRWPDGSIDAYAGAAGGTEATLAQGRGPLPAVRVLAPRPSASSTASKAAPQPPSPGSRVALPEVPGHALPDVEPQVAEAIHDARERVVATPLDVAAWGRLGVLLHAHGLLDQAATCHARAEELAPGDGRFPYLLGLALLQRDPAGAEAAFSRALVGSPRFVPALVHRGHALRHLGRLDEAEQSLGAAVSLDKTCAEAWLSLAQVKAARGQLAEAKVLLLRCLELAPGAREPHLELAALAARLGDTQIADQAAQAAAQLPPGALLRDPLLQQVDAENLSSGVAFAHADSLRTRGDLAGALAILDAVVGRQPTLASARLQRALLRRQLGDEAGGRADEAQAEALIRQQSR